jgi:predicted nucleic acid-binding protein
MASSAISRIELVRAVRRAAPAGREQDVVRAARGVLTAINILAVDDQVIESAASLDPPRLRSLDALHLAAALRIRGSVTGFVCYDQRLTQAAVALGLPVISPG